MKCGYPKKKKRKEIIKLKVGERQRAEKNDDKIIIIIDTAREREIGNGGELKKTACHMG